MSTSLNSRASHMKLAIIQQIKTPCSNSYKDYPRASDKRSSKTQQSRPMTKWSKRWSVSLCCSASLMCYTNEPWTTPHKPVSPTPGKPGDNASKMPKTHKHNDKDLDRPHSIPLWPQNHKITNQSQWTLTEPGLPEEIEEDKARDSCKGTSLGLTTPEPKEAYRVHVSIVDNKDTLLAIALSNRNVPTHKWPNLQYRLEPRRQ